MQISRFAVAARSSINDAWYSRLLKLVVYVICLLAIGYILVFTVLAIQRMLYPYELEWTESAFFDQVRWIAQGKFPYGPPDIAFLPLTYTPLYFYFAAALAKVTGVSLLAPRLISILAVFGCFALLIIIVRDKTKRLLPGLLAAGLFAASYRFTGAWMDLAKTDSLFLLVILFAFWIGIRYTNKPGLLLSGCLFALAYFTKQIALPLVLVLAPISLLFSRGRTLLQWLAAFSAGAIVFVALDLVSQGWSSFYTLETVLYHERVLAPAAFWINLLYKTWPAFLLAFIFTALAYRSTRQSGGNWHHLPWQYLGFSLALVLASWSIYFKTWTYDNGMMPACLGLALLSGLAYHDLQATRDDPTFSPYQGAAIQAAGIVLIFIQFCLFYYNPLQQLPTGEDRLQTREFLQFTQQLPGKVWIFSHTYYGYLTGENPYFDSAPFGDIVGGQAPPPGSEVFRRRELTAEVFQQAISEQIFDWIIVDQYESFWSPYYIPITELSYDFYPVTGARTRPKILMTRNPAAGGGALSVGNSPFDAVYPAERSSPQIVEGLTNKELAGAQ